MKVKDLIANLKKQNLEGEVYVMVREDLVDDVFEVTDGKSEDGTEFTVIIPDLDEE